MFYSWWVFFFLWKFGPKRRAIEWKAERLHLIGHGPPGLISISLACAEQLSNVIDEALVASESLASVLNVLHNGGCIKRKERGWLVGIQYAKRHTKVGHWRNEEDGRRRGATQRGAEWQITDDVESIDAADFRLGADLTLVEAGVAHLGRPDAQRPFAPHLRWYAQKVSLG